jgi:hypothetical protein
MPSDRLVFAPIVQQKPFISGRRWVDKSHTHRHRLAEIGSSKVNANPQMLDADRSLSGLWTKGIIMKKRIASKIAGCVSVFFLSCGLMATSIVVPPSASASTSYCGHGTDGYVMFHSFAGHVTSSPFFYTHNIHGWSQWDYNGHWDTTSCSS